MDYVIILLLCVGSVGISILGHVWEQRNARKGKKASKEE